MFVCMNNFRIQVMTSSLLSANSVNALEPYIPFIHNYSNDVYSWSSALHLFIISTRKYNISMAYIV